jgi:hypothetical protein
MSQVYFLPSSLGFIPSAWKEDGTFSEESWPSDAILLTDSESDTFWKQVPPEGQQLGMENGRPAWVEIPAPTAEQSIAQADAEKEALLATATAKIVVWQTKLLMGRKLTDSETTQLNGWIDYIDSVSSVDTTKIPAEFPSAPGN